MTRMEMTTVRIMAERQTMSMAKATFLACFTLFSLSHTFDLLFQTLEKSGPNKAGETADALESSGSPGADLVAMA